MVGKDERESGFWVGFLGYLREIGAVSEDSVIIMVVVGDYGGCRYWLRYRWLLCVGEGLVV